MARVLPPPRMSTWDMTRPSHGPLAQVVAATVGNLLLGLQEQWPDSSRTAFFRALPADPLAWVLQTFARYFQTPAGVPVPLAPHHEEIWRWIWALRPGLPQAPLISILARGGGKSTSAELGSAVIGYYGLRRYGLYVSSTQSQADDHLMTISAAFEQLGVERAINKYGVSRGWRVNRLRTADGFTMDAYGLDSAQRGVRVEESRPDLIILDDLDDQHDTALTIQKKALTLTRKILPTGTASTAILGIQNIPNRDGIFAQLVDGRADFLLDRTVAGPYPALEHLPAQDWFRREESADGTMRLRLTGGVPVWAGQGLAECEALLTLIGPQSFLAECQHQVAALEGEMFRRAWFPLVSDYPRTARLVRWWDFAGTEVRPGIDPDWTVGLLMGEQSGQFSVIDMVRERCSPGDVERLAQQTAAQDGRAVEIWIGQEPGSSGKYVVSDFQRRVLRGYAVYSQRETGSKAERAKPVSSAAQAGNVLLVEGPWVRDFLEEVCHFPDPAYHDDIVDCLSGAHWALTRQRTPQILDLTF
jgi:predicted phage terminase large subunit-like protein